ncbi:hypothetical protein M8C21_029592 [Ambrosia artemisiifolia]|uniref:Uncharacterized protein n=1 Tax=Ambrosia artemisiifolia TaxID=4212 RepID=A0AAD5CJC3_AMBAR|nr:hypothetical protein M8C21_029592 [Ambrosia artemisiifolia]
MLMVLRGNGLSKEPGRVLRSSFPAANLGFRHFSDEQIKVACLRHVWIGDPQATLDMLEVSNKSANAGRWGRVDVDHPHVINVQNYRFLIDVRNQEVGSFQLQK